MNDLVITVAIFGAAVLATTRRDRATPLIVAMTIVMLLAFLLQLTRATYLGMAIGLLIATTIALTRGASVRRILVRRITLLLTILSVGILGLVGLGSSNTPTTAINERISSGLSQVSEKTGTVGYRVNLYSEMLHILGSRWPVGLGFLHPRDKFFPSLPSGSIRNDDVGLLNAVMTMGVIGLLLLFGVLIAVAHHVARTASGRPTWLVVGLFGWLSLLAATSPTLVTLFSPTGLISVGLTLVLCSVDMPFQLDLHPNST
jgi:hypothetical protein